MRIARYFTLNGTPDTRDMHFTALQERDTRILLIIGEPCTLIHVFELKIINELNVSTEREKVEAQNKIHSIEGTTIVRKNRDE